MQQTHFEFGSSIAIMKLIQLELLANRKLVKVQVLGRVFRLDVSNLLSQLVHHQVWVILNPSKSSPQFLKPLLGQSQESGVDQELVPFRSVVQDPNDDAGSYLLTFARSELKEFYTTVRIFYLGRSKYLGSGRLYQKTKGTL